MERLPVPEGRAGAQTGKNDPFLPLLLHSKLGAEAG